MVTNLTPTDTARAYEEGRRIGLATAALALGVAAFVNLLGLEKSLLAGALAVMALRGGASAPSVRRSSWAALVLAALHVVTIIVLLVLFRDQLMQLLTLLQKLS